MSNALHREDGLEWANLLFFMRWAESEELKHLTVKIFPDGREVCNKYTAEGRRIYVHRTIEMLVRQGYKCCLCGLPLSPREATFDHENGRGMGGAKTDDRVVLPDGRWINGAAHWLCNSNKGSRFVDYNRNREAAGC